jgi:5'-nucleotidase
LNVNVPDVPREEITGFEVTRLGKRHKAEPAIKAKSPRGEDVFWIGPAGAAADAGPGTDFYATDNRRVSITPLQVDLTNYQQMKSISSWMGQA